MAFVGATVAFVGGPIGTEALLGAETFVDGAAGTGSTGGAMGAGSDGAAATGSATGSASGASGGTC